MNKRAIIYIFTAAMILPQCAGAQDSSGIEITEKKSPVNFEADQVRFA